jgi:hypothetical protein
MRQTRPPHWLRWIRTESRLLARRRRRLARVATALLGRLGRLSRRAIRAGIVLGVIAGASLAAGVLAATFYGQFGYHPGQNADAWSSRQPAFVGARSCGTCHPAQSTAWVAAPHKGVACESCHGPLAGHPNATPTPAPVEAAAGASAPPVPLLSLDERSSVGLPSSGSIGLCLTCHRVVVGRPSGFPTIDPARHYAGPECIVCHDPHTVTKPQPPAILHPLAGMPECAFCHSPTGMRPLPDAHPTWSGSCLTCHRATQP